MQWRKFNFILLVVGLLFFLSSNVFAFDLFNVNAPAIGEHLAIEVNSELPPELKRNLGKLLEGFRNGSNMEIPTILMNNSGKLHLVSGNNRLMVCRALGIKPKVIMGRIDY